MGACLTNFERKSEMSAIVLGIIAIGFLLDTGGIH
jgi:hypothetical protein